MKKILVIDNFDSFTFNLVDYFRKTGNEVVIVRNTISPEKISEYKPDLIVFSPGPGSPEQAGNMIPIIEQYHESIPMLGVCLGHQAMVMAFGGDLKRVNPVHGKVSKILLSETKSPLFKELPDEFEAGRYHSLAANTMPECLNITAMSEDDVVMALQHNIFPIYGVQFHPESILTYKNNVGMKIITNLLNSL